MMNPGFPGPLEAGLFGLFCLALGGGAVWAIQTFGLMVVLGILGWVLVLCLTAFMAAVISRL